MTFRKLDLLLSTGMKMGGSIQLGLDTDSLSCWILSKEPNWIGSFPFLYLLTEADLASEASCNLKFI
jgi:hypothetical protein